MQIELTNEQYSVLTKMAAVACTMADGVIDLNSDPEIRKLKNDLSDLEDYIFDQFENFNVKDMMRCKSGDADGDESFHQTIGAISTEYDEFVFWRNLVDNLVTRDLRDKYGSRLQEMDYSDIEEEERTLFEKYEAEFEENGLKNLRVYGEIDGKKIND